MIYIREGSHVYTLLLLLATTGEYPVSSLHLLGSKRTWKTLIQKLCKTQEYCLKDVQKTAIEVMEKMSEMMGVRFNVFETWTENGKRYYLNENGEKTEGNPNGFYDTKTGEIYIDLNAGNDYQGTMLFTVAHELTHFMRQWSPEHFTRISKIVFKHAGFKGRVSALIAAKMESRKAKGSNPISYDTAVEEVVADAMETILKDGKVVEFMAEVKQKDHKAWAKLKEWFKNFAKFLKELVDAYSGHSAQTVEGRKVAEFSRDILQQIEQIWAEGALSAGENYQAAEVQKNTTDDGGEAPYSLREFEDGTRFVDVQTDAHIFDGMTVAEMNKAVKPILMERFAGKVIGIDNRVFVNGDSVNEYLHPSKSIDMATRRAKLTAAGELDNLLDAGKALPNRPDGEDGHIHPDVIDFSYFKTIFRVGNEYFEGIVNIKNNKRGRLLKDITQIKNITQDIVSSYGDNPKSNFLRDASMHSIRDESNIVNTKSAEARDVAVDAKTESGTPAALKSERKNAEAGNAANLDATQSQQFKRWFGDWQNAPDKASKVVNADGTPKVMYHGSPAQFTIFDRKKAKSSGQFGSGFYFTDSQTHAATYGQHYSVYLNIRDPLQYGRSKVSKAQVRKFLETVAENEDYSIENYGTYDVDGVLQIVMDGETNVDAFQLIQDVSATAIGNMVEATELFNKVNGTKYDGIIAATETVAFYPEQIKSATDNIGTFDGSNPDIRYSDRKEVKTFKNGQNAKGEFVADVLIDLADEESKWWTGKYNHAIFGMSKTDDTEFRQFYQEILKRTKDMDEYGETEQSIVEDSFTVQDGKGREYIYRVALDGYLHGVVLAKTNKTKYEAYVKKYEGRNNYGRSSADTVRRVVRARTDLGRKNASDGRSERSESNFGSSRVVSTSSQGNETGNDRRGESPNQEVSTVTTLDGQIKTDGETVYSDRDSIKYDDRYGDFDYSQLSWAEDLGVITKKDKSIFTRTINNEIFRGAKPQSANGEYIIDTGKCLMFTNGDFHNPTLSYVIVFATEYESLTDYAKRRIIDEAAATGKVHQSLSAIESIFGKGFVSSYAMPAGRANARQNRRRKGNNGSGNYQTARAKSLKERFAEEGLSHLLEDEDSDSKFSERNAESVSNRSLLANALEATVQDDTERQKLQEYREQIARLDELESSLQQLNAQIKELSFDKGPRDTKKIRELRDEATKIANRISTYDKRLLRLETLEQKPAKKWESFVDKVVWAVAAALIAFILSYVGLG